MMAVPSAGTSERPRRGRGCDGMGRELPLPRRQGQGTREGPSASGLDDGTRKFHPTTMRRWPNSIAVLSFVDLF